MKNKERLNSVEETNSAESNEQKEETGVEENTSKKINVIKLEKKENDKPFYEVVENERISISKSYKKTSMINNILLLVVAAVFIGSFILITRGTWGQITGWVLIGVTIAGLVVYYLLSRKKYPELSRKYFKVFWEETNNYLFDDEQFSDCEIDIDERYQLSDVVAERAYKDIVSVASRNIVRGKYNGKEFSFGELGLYRPGPKKISRDVVFVGRHLELNSKLSIGGRYIVNIRKEESPVDLPTDIEDLVVLHEDGLMTIYGEEGAKYEKDLDKSVLTQLQSLTCQAPLLNINVVFFDKKTFCYLSYDDSIVAIPFEKPIDAPSYEILKRNINDVFDILSK